MYQDDSIIAALAFALLCVLCPICALSVDVWGEPVEAVVENIVEELTPEPVRYFDGVSCGSFHYGDFHIVSSNYERGEIVVTGREFNELPIGEDAEQHYSIQLIDDGSVLITYYGVTSDSEARIWTLTGDLVRGEHLASDLPVHPLGWSDIQVTGLEPGLSRFTLQRTEQIDGCYHFDFASVDAGPPDWPADWLFLKLCSGDILTVHVIDEQPFE